MLRVQDFMTVGVQTISPSSTAAEAAEAMRRNRIRHLVVINEKNVVGVISDRDIGRVPKNELVCDLMTANAATIDPKATAREVANKLRGRTIGCLPVMSNGKLAGIVTTSDLLDLLGRGVQRIEIKGERRAWQRNKRSFVGA